MDHRIWVPVGQASANPAITYLETYFVLSVAIRGMLKNLFQQVISLLKNKKRAITAQMFHLKFLFIFLALASTMEFLPVMGALDFLNGVFAED